MNRRKFLVGLAILPAVTLPFASREKPAFLMREIQQWLPEEDGIIVRHDVLMQTRNPNIYYTQWGLDHPRSAWYTRGESEAQWYERIREISRDYFVDKARKTGYFIIARPKLYLPVGLKVSRFV